MMGGGMGGMGGGMGGMFAVPDDTTKAPATSKAVAAPANKPLAITHGSSSVNVDAWVAKLQSANDEQRAVH